jgi:hypothetical protein
MRRMAWVLAMLMMAATITSCAKVPQAELDMAKAKIEELKQMEADAYAPAEYRVVVDSLSAAEREIEAQNGKFALFRSYGKVKTTLAAVTTLSETAKQAAIAGKERARQEADALIMQAQAALDSTAAMVKRAPKGKESKAEIELIKTDHAAAMTSLDEARAAYGQEDYLGAKAKAEAVLSKANGLMSELQAAMDKYKAARGR